jgi:hypothetical protein
VIDRDGCDIDLPVNELSTLQAMRHILLTSNDNGNAGSDMIFEVIIKGGGGRCMCL